ncbi:MAG TPA: cation:proton antiporter [Ilumatobacter sp.]|nr:cation:proton antiporter [Ilumatobacter sp.]
MLAAQVLYSVELSLLLLATSVLVGPLVAERLRVPSLVGLIAVGTVLGPSVLEWLRPGGFVATVGVFGLLYLMFVAGIELDLNTFAANRKAALAFGVLTFAVPFVLAAAVAVWHLDLGTRGVALLGAMWASHTVVAYPEAKAAGVDRSRVVGISLAATMITDIASLVVLAVAASGLAAADDHAAGTGGHGSGAALPLWLALLLLAAYGLAVLPRLTQWAFAHLLHSRTQRYMWLLAGMAGGATLGLAGGIEGLVGAFVAGIGMNRSVPARGALMERVEFVGNAILIPAFLVSVGLSIDPAALVEPSTLALAGVFTLLVIVGKAIAAGVAARLFGFSATEAALMASLTIGQAAATLAIAQVGTATGLFDTEIRDAAVVTIVITVFVTSFGTRWAARRLGTASGSPAGLGEHVVVQAPTTELAESLANVVTAIARPDSGLVTPFTALPTRRNGPPATADLDAFAGALTRCGHDNNPVVRLGHSLGAATIALAREAEASLVVVPVNGARFPLHVTEGGQVDEIGQDSTVPCLALRLQPTPWSRLVVVASARRDTAARDDLALLGELTRRLDEFRHVPLRVFVPYSSAADPFRWHPELTVSAYRPRSVTPLDALEPGDLLLLPTDTVADAGLIARTRAMRVLNGVGVIVAAGPARLRVTSSRPQAPLVGAVTPRRMLP